MSIRVAIAGVGNCASSLVQGAWHYGTHAPNGVISPMVGPYAPGDMEFVAAFDIDRRKVGLPLDQAIRAEPNCAMPIAPEVVARPVVQMGPVLDGCAAHMEDYPDREAFRVSDAPPCDVVRVLVESRAEVLVNYMPVGSQQATEFYARAALEAGCAFVNCVPVFIASDPAWAARFRDARLPIIGDDIKSQVGATILHRLAAHLFTERGYTITRTYQLNTGGNTDFLNMREHARLASKKKSKTGSVVSQIGHDIPARDVHIGPSDYVPWQGDNKVAFIRLEGTGFGGAPIELEMRLSVQDSPNSAGVVLDAVRYARLALDEGWGGPVYGPSAYLMKTPPLQMTDAQAAALCQAVAVGRPGALTWTPGSLLA